MTGSLHQRAGTPFLFLILLLIAFLAGIILPRFRVVKEHTCRASWYGGKFHGRISASGDIYNLFKFSAAHRTLPLGSLIRVQDPKTGRRVIVRISDRGPYRMDDEGRVLKPLQPHPRRELDLSYGAARKLGILEEGVRSVRVEHLD